MFQADASQRWSGGRRRLDQPHAPIRTDREGRGTANSREIEQLANQRSAIWWHTLSRALSLSRAHSLAVAVARELAECTRALARPGSARADTSPLALCKWRRRRRKTRHTHSGCTCRTYTSRRAGSSLKSFGQMVGIQGRERWWRSHTSSASIASSNQSMRSSIADL